MLKFLETCKTEGKEYNIVLNRFYSEICIKNGSINTKIIRKQSIEIKSYIRNALSLELLQKFNVKLVDTVVKTGFITEKINAIMFEFKALFEKRLYFCSERRMINKAWEKKCIGNTINKVSEVLYVPYCLGSCTKDERQNNFLFYVLGIVHKNVITNIIGKTFIIKFLRELSENTIYAFDLYAGRLCRR